MYYKEVKDNNNPYSIETKVDWCLMEIGKKDLVVAHSSERNRYV